MVGSVVGLVAGAINPVWPVFELRRPAHGWCQMGGGKAGCRSDRGEGGRVVGDAVDALEKGSPTRPTKRESRRSPDRLKPSPTLKM